MAWGDGGWVVGWSGGVAWGEGGWVTDTDGNGSGDTSHRQGSQRIHVIDDRQVLGFDRT